MSSRISSVSTARSKSARGRRTPASRLYTPRRTGAVHDRIAGSLQIGEFVQDRGRVLAGLRRSQSPPPCSAFRHLFRLARVVQQVAQHFVYDHAMDMREAACSCGQLRVRVEGEPGPDLDVSLLRLPAPDRQRILDAGPLPEGAGAGWRAAYRTMSARTTKPGGANVPLLPRLRLDGLVPDRPGADRRPHRQLRRSQLPAPRVSVWESGRRHPWVTPPKARSGTSPTNFGSARAARPSRAARRACGRASSAEWPCRRSRAPSAVPVRPIPPRQWTKTVRPYPSASSIVSRMRRSS